MRKQYLTVFSGRSTYMSHWNSQLFEPVQDVHRRLIEGQRDLVGKVPVDFENDTHTA